MTVHRSLRRLSRRLAAGLFLDTWPAWAAASLAAAGIVTLVCRAFVPAAAPRLPWLWVAPVLAAVPALVACYRRSYSSADVVALADSLSGGRGSLLALFETGDAAWRDSALAERAFAVALPRLRPWPRIAVLLPAAAFMAAAFWVPQRAPQRNDMLAAEIAKRLEATVAELRQQQLVTAAEEKRLDEEIERIRRSTERRVDASSWEAVDALNDRIAAGVAEKRDAIAWARESLARFGEASKTAGAGTIAAAETAELTKALQRLQQQGLLHGAPDALEGLMKSGRLPTDPAALRALLSSLSRHLADANGRIAGLSQMGKAAGRFNPSEFPLAGDGDAADQAGRQPGNGGVSRGRGDAELTWGKESAPLDRFKEKPLPPGAPRSPDDWAPVVELPGAPDAAPVLSAAAAARQYAAVAGQSAWRRTLAPRHQSAVKKYFDK